MSDLETQRRIRTLEDLVERLRKVDAGTATGTYTPTYYGATTVGVTTYTTQVGAYTRIGNCLFFTAQVVWTAATGTGVAVISLPFFSANVTNQWFACAVFHSTVTFTGSGVMGVILPNTDYVQFYSPLSNATRADVVIEAAGQIVVSGMYMV